MSVRGRLRSVWRRRWGNEVITSFFCSFIQSKLCLMAKLQPYFYYEQILFSAALSCAVEHGYYFGTDCEHNFKLMLRRTVRSMAKNNLLDDKETMNVARSGITELVIIMIAEVEQENKWKRLRESSLLAAWVKFCPRFPFC